MMRRVSDSTTTPFSRRREYCSFGCTDGSHEPSLNFRKVPVVDTPLTITILIGAAAQRIDDGDML